MFKEKRTVGRAGYIEPITICKKTYGIKILSVYEFLCASNMADKMTKNFISQGFEPKFIEKICKDATLVSFCFYGKEEKRIFKDGMEAIENLTPEELKSICDEYKETLENISRHEKLAKRMLQNIKNRIAKTA